MEMVEYTICIKSNKTVIKKEYHCSHFEKIVQKHNCYKYERHFRHVRYHCLSNQIYILLYKFQDKTIPRKF